jgi:hypothetical protein
MINDQAVAIGIIFLILFCASIIWYLDGIRRAALDAAGSLHTIAFYTIRVTELIEEANREKKENA